MNKAEDACARFGRMTQHRRDAKRMTQDELATAVGVSRPQIANIEAGRGGTSAYRALLIARALGTTVEDLFGLGDKKEPTTIFDAMAKALQRRHWRPRLLFWWKGPPLLYRPSTAATHVLRVCPLIFTEHVGLALIRLERGRKGGTR